MTADRVDKIALVEWAIIIVVGIVVFAFFIEWTENR
jgi:hypothetical protein